MSITWNGVSSDTIGVIVERIPNRYVPTRRFSPQQVAGRNGNILLVDKSFPNVEQEYEVYLSAEAQGLPSVARACAEWLMGPDGYCRLEDSYDTTVYREAFLMGGYDLENILNKFGRCTITFSCKPQKYLLTGDTPIEIPDGATTTYTGDVVQFDVITGASITSLSTTLSPIQDLHGYTSPWPAGGGKNKLEINSAIAGTYNQCTFTVADDGTIRVSGTPTQQTRRSLTTQTFSGMGTLILSGTIPTGIRVFCKRVGGGSTTYPTLSNGTTLDTDTYTFDQLALEVNTTFDGTAVDLRLQIESGSSPTSFAPYSNICPISGRTGLSVYRTGKNLFNPHLYAGIDYNPTVGAAVTLTDAAQQFTDNGSGVFTLTTSSTWRQYSIVIPVVEVNNYHVKFSCSSSGQMGTTRGFLDANHKVLEKFNSTDVSQNYNYNMVFPTGAAYFFMVITNRSTASATLTLTQPQFEISSTATVYEPYNGNTISVDWTTDAGTVYGGTVDVVTGVLTVDRANIASYNGEVINEPWLSSMDEYAPGATPTTGAQVVYKLATPLTYQLTAQEIGVLVGTNNVWSSSGDVSVTVTTLLGGIVTNPTPFEARPLLTVSGVGEITVNGKSIQILESVSDFEIDCEAMEAEDNSKIYCMDFPELSGGENKIVGYGSITALTVTPRWWTL